MPATLPAGIGNSQQAMQATGFIREQPWYQELVRSWGLDPKGDENGNVRLTEDQQQAVLKAAQDHGIGISEDSYHIDENGQIAKNDSHWVRNALIGAGIGAAALTGFGAAGIGPLSGLFGAGAGSAAAASPFAIPATEGIASATSLGLPVTAGLGTAGTVAGAAGGAGAALKGASSLSKIGDLLDAGGKAVGAVTQAAGQNNLNQEQLGLQAANTDISGQHANVDEQIGVSNANAKLKAQDLKNQFMLDRASHPSVSPFNVTGGPKYSPEYLSSLQQIAAQHPDLLTKPAPYKPITPSGLQKATGTEPSTMQKIGEILSPAMSVAPKLVKLF